jgi:malonyl-CoA O-methyltransferase
MVPALDKSRVRRSFDRASLGYDAAAVLPAEVRTLLLDRLQLTALKPRIVLDAGAGTLHASRALKRRYPAARIIALDSSLGMLRAAPRRRSWFRPVLKVCADAENLPLADGSVDLILSNFMLPWADPDTVFAEWRRVLAPRGLLTFTTLGPDTLKELRTAWAEAGGIPAADLAFLDMHDLGDGLLRAGFAAPVLDVEHYTLEYRDLRHLAQDLKATGARNAAPDRPHGLMGRRKFSAVQVAYERYRHDGRLPATYEVVFGQAWAPTAPRAPADATAHVSLAELKRQLTAKRPPPTSGA